MKEMPGGSQPQRRQEGQRKLPWKRKERCGRRREKRAL
jgi:hypothetical protein